MFGWRIQTVAWKIEGCDYRRDIDYGTVSIFSEMRKHFSGNIKKAEHVGSELAIYFFLWSCLKWANKPVTRVIDQNVNSAKVINRIVNSLFNGIVVKDIQFQDFYIFKMNKIFFLLRSPHGDRKSVV